MAEPIGVTKPFPYFEYELFEGPDNLRTVSATPAPASPHLNPSSLKLKHRIGRGRFGDVWLATHHCSGDDYDEYHEVAVKMLFKLKEDQMPEFLDRFENLFHKLRELKGVCWLRGVSVIEGKICIAMKFYEGSVANRIAQAKGGKLQVSDILRYGVELAKGIIQLHSIGILVLNLKPSNFLLDEHNQAVLGDFGIPFLLFGIVLSNLDAVLTYGTPNYMAPEQWEPRVRGPVSFETDSWGFGCSIVEMLTGKPPWFGKSMEEIYDLVVVKQQKPSLPCDLPPSVENILRGCFEYDLRYRPSVADILYAFESSWNAVYSDGKWLGLETRAPLDRSNGGPTVWYLSKDHLQVDDMVCSRKTLNPCKPQTIDVLEGTVVSLEGDTGYAMVKTPDKLNPARVQVSNVQRVTSGLAAGDWVHLKEGSDQHSSVGLLHSIQRNGDVAVGFIGLETLWTGNTEAIEKVEAFDVGQFVRLKTSVFFSRFEWPRKGGGAWATGRILQVLPNGCLVAEFPGMFVMGNEPNTCLADPAEVELVSFRTCSGVVKKYQHFEDFHWAVRPLTMAFGLITAVKLGLFVGRNVRAKLKKREKDSTQHDSNCRDGHADDNASWLPPNVSNILFKESLPAPTSR